MWLITLGRKGTVLRVLGEVDVLGGDWIHLMRQGLWGIGPPKGKHWYFNLQSLSKGSLRPGKGCGVPVESFTSQFSTMWGRQGSRRDLTSTWRISVRQQRGSKMNSNMWGSKRGRRLSRICSLVGAVKALGNSQMIQGKRREHQRPTSNCRNKG